MCVHLERNKEASTEQHNRAMFGHVLSPKPDQFQNGCIFYTAVISIVNIDYKMISSCWALSMTTSEYFVMLPFQSINKRDAKSD